MMFSILAHLAPVMPPLSPEDAKLVEWIFIWVAVPLQAIAWVSLIAYMYAVDLEK